CLAAARRMGAPPRHARRRPRPCHGTGADGPGARTVTAPSPERPDRPAFRVPRRIVTGHDTSGASVVVSDGPVPVTRELPEDGVAFHEIWVTSTAPAIIGAGAEDPTADDITVPPPAHGTRIRINEFLPHSLDEHGLQSPMHRTQSIDYGIVLEGEITLIL